MTALSADRTSRGLGGMQHPIGKYPHRNSLGGANPGFFHQQAGGIREQSKHGRTTP